MNLANRC